MSAEEQARVDISNDIKSKAKRLGSEVQQSQEQDVQLSFEAALERALSHNLDIRVSALEALVAQGDVDIARLQAFPDFSVSYMRSGRSNEGASSSRSILSGNESLEPSISSDRYRAATDLDMRWDVLDIALAALDVKNDALIQKQQHRQVVQTIVRDLYQAYWLAWVAQEAQEDIDRAQKQVRKVLDGIDAAGSDKTLMRHEVASYRADLMSELVRVQGMQEQFAYSVHEFKALLSLPAAAKLKLEDPSDAISFATLDDVLRVDLAALSDEALDQRPEMQEAILQIQNARTNARQEVVGSFPGAKIFVGYNKDSNSFLEDDAWMDFSLSVTQSLVSLMTLPQRYKHAKNLEEYEREKAVASAMALISQVHIARHRLDILENNFEDIAQSERDFESLYDVMHEKYKAGFVSRRDLALRHMKMLGAKLQTAMAKAELIDAQVAMLITLGRDMKQASPMGFAQAKGTVKQ